MVYQCFSKVLTLYAQPAVNGTHVRYFRRDADKMEMVTHIITKVKQYQQYGFLVRGFMLIKM